MTLEGFNEFSRRLLEFRFELFPLLFCHYSLHSKIIQHPKTCGYTRDMPNEILLRDVTASDLPILYEQQLDPEATATEALRLCGSS